MDKLEKLNLRHSGNNEQELWKAVEGFEGLYEVSNFGRIRSLDRKVWVEPPHTRPYFMRKYGTLLKPAKKFNGFLEVNLIDNKSVARTYVLSRLVAKAFLDKPKDKDYVAYKDGNKDNCRADNLIWVDFEQSGRLTGLQTNSKKVRCIETGKIYASERQASIELGFSHQYVCMKMRSKKQRGRYHFEYVED